MTTTGDHSFVRCPENHLVADIEFKTKGYFSGTYNAIGGTIKDDRNGEVLFELSGLWNGEMSIKNTLVRNTLGMPYLKVAEAYRPVIEKYCSMQPTPNTLHLWYDQCRSRESGNHKNYGTPQLRQ